MSKQLKKWTVFLLIFSLAVTLCLPTGARAQETSMKNVSERYGYYDDDDYDNGDDYDDSEDYYDDDYYDNDGNDDDDYGYGSDETETEESVPKDTIPEGYIGIYDIGDLYAIRNDVSAKYILMDDIDLSVDTAEGGAWNQYGHGWTPIEEFYGELDGNGHRIIGMHIYGKISQNVGLFEELMGTIRNLGMVDISIDVEYDADNGGDIYVGGITGYAYSGEGAAIEECYTMGNIIVSDFESGEYYECSIGGILGCGSIDIKNVYNACNITVDKSSYVEVGGVCGYCRGGHFAYSYNQGTISGVTDGETYPIFYYDHDYDYYASIQDCHYLSGTASKNMDSGCTALSETQLKDERALTGFDFDKVWTIDKLCAYPYPQLKNNRQIRISSLDLATAPSKTEYEQGDALDISGATIKIIYEDATTATIPVSEDMVSGYDMNVIGAQNVTISYGGVSITYPITVKEVSLTSIALNHSKVSLDRNKTLQLSVSYTPANASNKTIIWTTSDASVATVDANGLVTGKNKGTATITATSANGLTAQCEVEVLIPCVTITLSQTSANMKIGDTLNLTAQMLPLETTDLLEWKSDNTAVADVINGNVTAYSAGSANITAYVEGGVSAVCKITVSSNTTADNGSDSGNSNTTDNGSDSGNNTIDKGSGSGNNTTDKDSGSGNSGGNNKNNADSITSVKGKISSIKNVKPRSIKLKLGKLGSAQGYQIEYSVKSNFKNSKKIKRTSSTVTIKKLKKNKKYYVRVRVYGKVNGTMYYGKWSAKKAIKIKK